MIWTAYLGKQNFGSAITVLYYKAIFSRKVKTYCVRMGHNLHYNYGSIYISWMNLFVRKDIAEDKVIVIYFW